MGDDGHDGHAGQSERPAKRQTDDTRAAAPSDLQSIELPVSPPRKRLRPDDEAEKEIKVEEGAEVKVEAGAEAEAEVKVEVKIEIKTEASAAAGADNSQGSGSSGSSGEASKDGAAAPRYRSPFQLTAVQGVPARDNIDTVTVEDVFGDPRVVECWNFNFCYDLFFLLGAFAQPQTVRLHVVHGFWLQGEGDRSRRALELQAKQAALPETFGAQHVYLHRAFLPEKYGTHHTKMAIFFRSDATAQVVIHTANMIPHDWHSMTQAVWRSPLLPLLTKEAEEAEAAEGAGGGAGGDTGAAVGRRFKRDLLNYLRTYDYPLPICRPLEEQLVKYDFSAVRAVLIGSVPGNHDIGDLSTTGDYSKWQPRTTFWGWAAMKYALQSVPLRPPISPPAPMAELIVQMSSIAMLGQTDAWLRGTLLAALSEGKKTVHKILPRPRVRIVFPTADEIRRSIVGYESGPSIHTKGKTASDKKRLQYIKPMLCHWANDCEKGGHVTSLGPHGDARRARIMPHVKTYIRFSSGGDGSIDWALLTSANLSRQAWGESKDTFGRMQISSYELGVLVWPELLAEGATMRPVFQRDTFDEESSGPSSDGDSSPPVVPLRMPYSLPLQPYSHDEMPWVANMEHKEPDWLGQHWRCAWAS